MPERGTVEDGGRDGDAARTEPTPDGGIALDGASAASGAEASTAGRRRTPTTPTPLTRPTPTRSLSPSAARIVARIARRETRLTTRRGWALGLTVVFAAFGFLLATFSGSGVAPTGYEPVVASYVELATFLVPLAALAFGHGAVVGAAERGRLGVVLTPRSRARDSDRGVRRPCGRPPRIGGDTRLRRSRSAAAPRVRARRLADVRVVSCSRPSPSPSPCSGDRGGNLRARAHVDDGARGRAARVGVGRLSPRPARDGRARGARRRERIRRRRGRSQPPSRPTGCSRSPRPTRAAPGSRRATADSRSACSSASCLGGSHSAWSSPPSRCA